MKKVFLVFIALITFSGNTQTVKDFTYDPGTYKRNPVRYPSIENNPWIDMTGLTLENIQEKIISILNGSHLYSSNSISEKPIIASFIEKDKPQLLSLTINPDRPLFGYMIDLRKIQEFRAVSTKNQYAHVLNIYGYRIDYEKYMINKKVKYKKYKFRPIIKDYNDARILMLLFMRYNEILKEMYPEYTELTINKPIN